MNKCTSCGSGDLLVVQSTAFMVVDRCSVCGHEQVTHVSPSVDPVLPPSREPIFTVMARWAREPMPEEIDRLKAQIPLMPQSANDLLKCTENREQFELGRLSESEVMYETPILEALGLELELIELHEHRVRDPKNEVRHASQAGRPREDS